MIYTRGKRKTYYYRFQFGGRIIHESARTTSKTVAKEAERQRRAELAAKWNHIERRKMPPTFEKAAKDWTASRAGTIAPRTASIAEQALKHLLPALGSKLLCDITPKHIRSYQSARRNEGMTGRTVNIEVGVLRQILSEHDFWRDLERDVTMLPENQDVGRALSRDEEERLLAECRKVDSACFTAVVLALNTSMRKDELCKLQWHQVDFVNRTLTVGKSKTAAGRGRVIPLNPDALKAILEWQAKFADAKHEHYVFPFCEPEHKALDQARPTKGWRTAWEHALKRSGIKCRFHDLRHTCISKLAEGQASDQTIMSIAGHVSRKMLERYSHIRMDAKRRAVEALSQPVTALPGINFGADPYQKRNQVESSENRLAAKLLN